MYKAKIVVVGPCESGKTVLSNFLGDQTDVINSIYRPTAGVRILEFEMMANDQHNNAVKVDVEMWDCSGNANLESCWPAMAYRADGVIIVFDPTQSRPEPSIDVLYNYFVKKHNLKPSHCLIFANSRSNEQRNVPSPISAVRMVATNFEKKGDDIHEAFKKLLENVLGKLSDSREKEELSIIS